MAKKNSDCLVEKVIWFAHDHCGNKDDLSGMNDLVLFLLLGMAMGIISGLGLGGGKILIPALVLFTSITQAQAQGITLFSFIPISVIAILTHMKEKNIKWSIVGWLVTGAVFGSMLGSMIAMGPFLPYLRTVFGVFLIVLGLFELFVKDRSEKEAHQLRSR